MIDTRPGIGPLLVRTPWAAAAPAPPAASSPALPTDVATVGATPAAVPEKADGMSRGRRLAAGLALLLAGVPIVASLVPALHPPPSTTVQTISLNEHVLVPGRFLKADQFPALQNKSLRVVEGAPNFRQIAGEPVFGVAQPTVDGIRNVLREVGAGPGAHGPAAVWTNLREEPVVYINGRPFNPRDTSAPFENMARPGASAREVEASDEVLKRDVLSAASRGAGTIMVSEESADGKVVSHLETVRSVQTPREVYDQLKGEGFRVDFARIPISDEKAPGEDDFQALVARLRGVDGKAPLIFNCHAGRGRTTTGMVVADLMRRGGDAGSISQSKAVREDIREQGDYRTGNYKVILSLIRAIENGPDSKAAADASIDRSSALQNLREAINGYRTKAVDPSLTAEQQKAAKQKGQDFLKRYFYLVAFDAYVKDQAPQGFKVDFSEWMKQNDLHRMLDNLQLAMNLPREGGTTAFA